MFYIWVDYKDGRGFEPHNCFDESEKEEADFEIQVLRDEGYKAKYGQAFPSVQNGCIQ